jgi:hypothetical protein
VRITDAEAEARIRSTIPRAVPTGEVEARLARMRALPRRAHLAGLRAALHVGLKLTRPRKP